MPNCFPQPRLSLCGSEETQRLRFEDHAGVFSAILRKARCHPLIEVLDIDAAVVGCPGFPALDTPRPLLLCGRSLQFRCRLPPEMPRAQALLFERDAEGTITLLSHPDLLATRVWYRHAVEVPRTDGLDGLDSPIGTIHLLVPGCSQLLLICCDDTLVRFHCSTLFRRPEFLHCPGPLSFPPVTASELYELARALSSLPPERWVAIARQVEVAAPPLYAGNIASIPQMWPYPAYQGRKNGAPLEKQSKLINHWAAQVTEPRFYVRNSAAIRRLGPRIIAASDAGLFIKGAGISVPIGHLGLPAPRGE